MIDAAAAARYNVRPLLPGPEEALRDAVLRLGLPAERLTALATHGAVEALAVQGLTQRPDARARARSCSRAAAWCSATPTAATPCCWRR